MVNFKKCFEIEIIIFFSFNPTDIDECEAIPGLCEGGICVNSIGSFTCECPEGQARNPETNACEDRDECAEGDQCENGHCVNTDGSFYCSCNTGFIPSQDRKKCIGKFPCTFLEVNYWNLL